MSDLLAGALSVLLATNQHAALTNLVAQKTGLAVAATNDPVEVEFRQLLADDDKSQEETESWVDEYDRISGGKRPIPSELSKKIEKRYDEVRRKYDLFIGSHTNHVKVHVAYGSFLEAMGDVGGMELEWEKARAMDPLDPAVWNNLAGHFAHDGPIEKAFPYFERAIELNPKEAEYRHNLGTVVFLFRKDSAEYYHTDEQGVFKKAFELYHEAMALRPNDFKLAADVAQTWYGVKPEAVPEFMTNAPALPKTGPIEERKKIGESILFKQAMQAWTNAYTLAEDEEDREGVRLHYARWQIRDGLYAEARGNLNLVTNETHLTLKARLFRSLTNHQDGVYPLHNSGPAEPADGK